MFVITYDTVLSVSLRRRLEIIQLILYILPYGGEDVCNHLRDRA